MRLPTSLAYGVSIYNWSSNESENIPLDRSLYSKKKLHHHSWETLGVPQDEYIGSRSITFIFIEQKTLNCLYIVSNVQL